MRLDEFLKCDNDVAIKKFIGLIEIIKQESSGKLMDQLNNRLTKLNIQIKHQQSREAILKRKIDATTEALNDAISNGLEDEIIVMLKGFKSELVSMLRKINYKDQDDERQNVFRIKRTIIDRQPLIRKILGIIENASTA